mmetsp:Transcript_25643/g.39420  ORF Transcript_25643/g.39420 Transcript_25643/m.39420 type:complete len:366 (+) Transcript_25643:64-1161(+)|eukprot:CAMPEP_0195297282 /NCGR_PEP_ID=MMETSP0707-20130614/21221_1 /TAXON_ID=33640 /ORGANISM="Asterionellopsis glacialis, Strain CCMP134" /LENGTH=365 /DNA_ID=CAMNT_0040359061 /DNA_START=46 /DNA_END=1143 /DNA_ORIENTATION=+
MKVASSLVLSFSQVLFCTLFLQIYRAAAFAPHNYFASLSKRDFKLSGYKHDDDADSMENDFPSSRRDFLKLGTSFTSSIFLLVGSATTSPVFAADDGTNTVSTDSIVDPKVVADRLRAVPTFAIVDKEGVPFMVVGEDAKVTGYFFTTYDEANRILKVARDSVSKNLKEAVSELRLKRKTEKLPPLTAEQERDEVGVNPWVDARISTVPLDFAVTLVTKTEASAKARGRALFKIAPAETDVNDALALDTSGKDELAEGKVPLFYFEDFVTEASSDNEKLSPLYFRKDELVNDWKKQNPRSQTVPDIRVSELFVLLTEMLKPGGTDEDLKTLMFVPPKESAKKAAECVKKGGKEVPFLIGKTIIVL